MSGKFDGFSEDDINKLTKPKKVVFNGRGVGIRRMPDNVNAASSTVPKMFDSNNSKSTKTTLTSTSVSLQQQQQQQQEQEKYILDLSVTTSEESIHFRPLSAKIIETKPENLDKSILHLEKPSENHVNDERCTENGGISSPFRGISLKDFETQRKIIEEQNKQKKEMLYKAIELHSQKTAAEVKKIEQIKTELAKLDSDLAVDVAILRKQIESACMHYANIQKQYDRIESQFLKAKLDLHNASERKELLTEHLCTVIAHNEDRKAKKLTELMEKVGISPSGEIENLDK